jgi:beta-glucosidase
MITHGYRPLLHIPLYSLIALLAISRTDASVSTAPHVRTALDAVTPTDFSRHAGFLRQIREGRGDFDLVLIGDSITDGWPSRGADSYAELLAWKPLDLGVSAERTEHVLYRITNGELDGLHPKAVMILIGTNNLGQSEQEQPAWTAAGVARIIATVRAKCPGAKILLMAIFPRSPKPTDEIRQRVSATNKLLAPLADGKDVFFMDISDRFLDGEGNLRLDLMPDALHPNAAGYQLWLQAVKPKLTELMSSK